MSTLICIGHITHDRILTPTLDLHIPGGTAWYFAWGMHALISSMPEGERIPYRLITSVGDTGLASVQKLREAGIQVDVLPSRHTVYFENKYLSASPNDRQQRVFAKADPFTWERLEPLIRDVDDPYFILGSLLADDFPLDVIRRLHERGRVILDVQGYLREVVGEEVRACDWSDKREALPCVDMLKVNEIEMAAVTGSTADPRTLGPRLLEWGAREVLLTLGDMGSVIYRGQTRVDVNPVIPSPLVDSTGCGDTYTMGYVLRRLQGHSLYDSGRFASALATLKLEHAGPFSGTYDDVLRRVEA